MGLGIALPNLLEYSRDKPHGIILVISGWRGVGKTSYCQNAIQEFKKAGLRVSGILSPARIENGQKTGIFAQNINREETRLAASTISGEIDGYRLGPYYFDEKVVQWENECIRRVKSTDLLVIDELGYLEFDEQGGIYSSFELLRKKDYRLALVIIRPERVETFRQMGFQFELVEIGP